jgi:hypothetical protein
MFLEDFVLSSTRTKRGGRNVNISIPLFRKQKKKKETFLLWGSAVEI